MLYEVITVDAGVHFRRGLPGEGEGENFVYGNFPFHGEVYVTRITSYNVCYTKLLRKAWGTSEPVDPAGSSPTTLTRIISTALLVAQTAPAK